MQLQILSGTQLVIEYRVLNNAAHAFQHFIRVSRHFFTEKFNFSRCRLHQIRDHFHHRCFAGPVGSKEPVDLALLNFHIYALYDFFVLIDFG
ncbi:hypothetical protein D3C81_1992600 [compost metagenome]